MSAATATDGEQRRRPRWRVVLTWLVVLGAVAGWAAFLRPASLGGPAGYVIVSGESMEPAMQTGDLAIVRRKGSYAVGDVVAYRIPASDVGGGMLVIHRVIDGSLAEGLILQGDNRDHPDVWRPKAGDVVGALQAHIPHAGTALFLFRTPLVLATAAGLLGFWFIVLRGDSEEDDVVEQAGTDDLEQPEALAPVPQAFHPAPAVLGLRAPAYRPLVGAALMGVAIGLAIGGSSRR